MMEISELINATGWTGIFQGIDCPVITFSINEVRKIRGLKRNEHTFYLDFPEYKFHPISFLVTDHKVTTQYYVIGDRLHRSGNPAKIITNPHGTTVQEYYYNGLPHNTDGPAIIEWDNLTIIDEIDGKQLPSSIIGYTYSAKRCFFWKDGYQTRYPEPHSLQFTEGIELLEREDAIWKPSSSNSLPYINADYMIINWHSPKDNKPFIRQLELSFVSFDHNYRLIKSNNVLSLHWVDDNTLIDFNEEQRQQVQKDLVSSWNLMHGPLFPNKAEESFFFATVNL